MIALASEDLGILWKRARTVNPFPSWPSWLAIGHNNEIFFQDTDRSDFVAQADAKAGNPRGSFRGQVSLLDPNDNIIVLDRTFLSSLHNGITNWTHWSVQPDRQFAGWNASVLQDGTILVPVSSDPGDST